MEAGFKVEKKEGFGRKRHRLEAVFSGTEKPQARLPTPTIMGAGIAGASLVKAFKRRGIIPNVIHNPAHKAASHNAAALVKPRLDLQDRPESRFFLSSYLYALRAYETHAIAEGITHIPKSDAEAERFEKLNNQAPLPPSHFDYDADGKRLSLKHALVIPPKTILDNWLKDVKLSEEVSNDSPLTLLAAGYGLKELLKTRDINLRFSRGQLTWAEAALNKAVTYGGYGLPLKEGVLLGATHQRLEGSEPFSLKDSDDIDNIENFKKFTGLSAEKSGQESRASIRVTTADTLPLMGEIENDLWLLTGLGSRGFVFAPLLAEAIVSKICGDPLPISKKVWARFGIR